MDIVERLAQQAAETINGGEFYDGKWYTEGQRQAWRKAMTPAADEIERLRQLVSEMGSVEYVIDGHGVAHHNFTIVYRELE